GALRVILRDTTFTNLYSRPISLSQNSASLFFLRRTKRYPPSVLKKPKTAVSKHGKVFGSRALPLIFPGRLIRVQKSWNGELFCRSISQEYNAVAPCPRRKRG